MKRLLRTLLRLGVLLLIVAVAGVVLLRVNASRSAREVDSWVTPSFHEFPTEDGYQEVTGIAWVPEPHRAEAERRLATEAAVPLEDTAELERLSGGVVPEGSTGCAPYLVRGFGHPAGPPEMTRVLAKGGRVDVSVYGGFGCRLSDVRRAPFVACLDAPPETVVTSFRCEPLNLIGWVLQGRGDRW